MTGALSIEYLAVGQLKVYDRNARTHSNRQILQIANSIREFGFTNPVLIDDRNMILAGHGRVRAADLLEIKEVPCVRLSTVTQAQKRACCCDDGGSTQVTEISAAPDIRPSPVVSSKPAPQCGLLLFEPDDAGCSELAIILSCHRKMLTPAHTRLTLDDEELSLLDAEFDIGVTGFPSPRSTCSSTGWRSKSRGRRGKMSCPRLWMGKPSPSPATFGFWGGIASSLGRQVCARAE